MGIWEVWGRGGDVPQDMWRKKHERMKGGRGRDGGSRCLGSRLLLLLGQRRRCRMERVDAPLGRGGKSDVTSARRREE